MSDKPTKFDAQCDVLLRYAVSNLTTDKVGDKPAQVNILISLRHTSDLYCLNCAIEGGQKVQKIKRGPGHSRESLDSG
ncbi:MAG: hypothetical protein ACRCSS_02740 [Shewanella sp.]